VEWFQLNHDVTSDDDLCVTSSPRAILGYIFRFQGPHVDPDHLHEAAERVHKALLKQFPLSNQGGRNAQKSLPQGHYHLFISYRVNTDSQIADFLYWYLKNKGWEPFMDKYCLEDGELWKSGFVVRSHHQFGSSGEFEER
jgi:hypothetical protein